MFNVFNILHKHFENIKTRKKISIRNMRPLNIRDPPTGKYWGRFFRLCVDQCGVDTASYTADAMSVNAGYSRSC